VHPSNVFWRSALKLEFHAHLFEYSNMWRALMFGFLKQDPKKNLDKEYKFSVRAGNASAAQW